MIRTDKKRYKQVLFNLLGNAVKFTFSGSITIRLSYLNSRLITKVTDTGSGIKPDEIQRLFQFFGKATSSKTFNQGGMGFGLTISKMIVSHFDGEIKVESI